MVSFQARTGGPGGFGAGVIMEPVDTVSVLEVSPSGRLPTAQSIREHWILLWKISGGASWAGLKEKAISRCPLL